MREGDVALATLPQADGQRRLDRWSFCVECPLFDDWLVCGVSTQLHQRVEGLDESIEPLHGDFAISGLKAASVIRLGFLTVLPASRFLGILGRISRERHHRLLQSLCRHVIPK